jgi:DNA-binding MarR family transcriptional regulator
VLRVVAGGPAQRMADLATRLEVVPRSVTTMVDALESAGLVARAPDPDDRRSVLVAPTARGRALVARLDAARRESAERIFGGLSRAQRDALASLLGALCAHGGCATCSEPHLGNARGPKGTPPADHKIRNAKGDRR